MLIDSLRRIREALKPGSNARRGMQRDRIEVMVRDLSELLRDWERLDAMARTNYEAWKRPK